MLNHAKNNRSKLTENNTSKLTAVGVPPSSAQSAFMFMSLRNHIGQN